MIQFQNEYITIFQSALYHTTSSVIQTEDCVLVVDPTWLPHEVEEIKRFVEEVRNGRELYIIFTHSDFDHILGYRAFKNATIIASEEFVNHSHKEEVVEQIKSFDDRYYLKRDYEIEYPDVDHVIKENGQMITIGETKITCFKAPGHTMDGIFTIVEPLGIFIAGDYLSDIEFPYIYFNSKVYEQTIQTAQKILQDKEIRMLIPGHGNVTEVKEEMLYRCEQSLNYISTIRESIKDNDPNKMNELIEKFPFPRNMKNYHDSNCELVKKELAES